MFSTLRVDYFGIRPKSVLHMKAKLLQIHWHEKEPIYSIHFDASGRFATAGGDHAIRVIPEGSPKLFYNDFSSA